MFEENRDCCPTGFDPITHRLQGKSALVTGATSGIGREIAKELAQHEVEVVAVGRTEEKLAPLAAQDRLVEDLCRLTRKPGPDVGSGLAVEDLQRLPCRVA